MPRGRKSMFDKPMTELERQHRCTERKKNLRIEAAMAQGGKLAEFWTLIKQAQQLAREINADQEKSEFDGERTMVTFAFVK